MSEDMDTFAFIIHPIDPKRDVSRKFPLLGKILTERQIDFFSTFFPPVYISEITGIVSQATGKEIKGWFVACPLTPRRMLELPERVVYRKIIQTGRLAERLGAKILGLGAFTSVVGDGGVTVAKALDIPVTTGDAYTVAVAVEALLEAGRLLEIEPSAATAAVVGATGTIGRVVAEMLAEHVGALYLIGRRQEALEAEQRRLLNLGVPAEVQVSTEMQTLQQADLVVTVSSAIETIIEPQHLRSGSVVCDVARPRDVSAQVAAVRDDVLVIDGGMVEVPGPVDFHFDFGFPPRHAYACMAETMVLALEGRFEDYTVGKHITRAQVDEIARMAQKHGFRLSGFRSFEQPVTMEQIARVRERAQRRRIRAKRRRS